MSESLKKQLRNKYLQLLKNVDAHTKKIWDEEIYQKFINSKYFHDNKIFAVYYSLPYEVSTVKIITTLLDADKKVALPRIENDNLKFYYINSLSDLVIDNRWNLYQPKKTEVLVNVKNIDVIILPLIAFNSDYYRIGHGKGYYDRFLSKNNNSLIKLVLAYKIQKIEGGNDFIDQWDVNFNILITNN